MNSNTVKSCMAVSMLLFSLFAGAQNLNIKEPYSDGMVLQQQCKARIRGKADAGARITVTPSWRKTGYTGTADEKGVWEVFVDTPVASYTKHSIKVKSGRESLELQNILVGEVWIAGGQSNMEMPLQGYHNAPVLGYDKVVSEPDMSDRIRMFTVGVTESFEPLDDIALPSGWKGACSATLPDMSATAYFFARTLSRSLDVPIGIVSMARGGSKVESWLPEEMLEAYGEPGLDRESIENSIIWGRPYVLYNGMMHPTAGYTARGFIWYQGCSNVGFHTTYADRMCDMVKLWREMWGDYSDYMPFYQVEITPFNYGWNTGAELRDAQHEAARRIPNGGIVVTDDLALPHEATQLHPANKEPVGRRLAYFALKRDYGFEGVNCDSPEATEAIVSDGVVWVKLKNAGSGLDLCSGIEGLEICGGDGVFHQVTDAVYDWDGLFKISHPDVPHPVEVRYCWGGFVRGNLHATTGLPLAPFRFVFEY